MTTSLIFYFHQTLCILGLFVTGLLFLFLIGMKDYKRILAFAYPAGLALWGVIGLVLLLFGVPYVLVSIFGAYVLFFAFLLYRWNKTYRSEYKGLVLFDKLVAVAIILFVVVLAMVCCLGVIGVAVSNDSYYYYSVYPQTIAIEGGYQTSFDVFLTDVGQTTAIINTLPWFFGFEETYGIQLFLGFNLLFIFGQSIFDVWKDKLGSRLTIIISVAAVVLLSTSTPYLVMTRWILANAYFMAYLFILFTFSMKMANGDDYRQDLPFVSLLILMLSMMRMEGGMMAGLYILCVCAVKSVKNKDILCFMIIPLGIIQAWYYVVIYMKLSVHPLYSFLDIKKSMVMLLFVVALLIYVCFVRNRLFGKLLERYELLVIAALVAGNAVLLVFDAKRYISNLKFMLLNIYLRNGWGYSYQIFLMMIAIIIIGRVVLWNTKRSAEESNLLKELFRISFPIFFLVCIVLFSVALCWARDGSLRVGIGDSGNRVLLQVIPFVIYIFVSEVCTVISSCYQKNKIQ